LTPVGRRLAQLPLDPRLARMVVEGERNGCVEAVLVIAAALSIQDPRERPAGEEQAAAEAHGRFSDDGSDFFTYLSLWRYLNEQQASLSSSQFRKLCKAEFLNYLRVREWQDVHAQLRQLTPTGLPAGDANANTDAVHRSLLAGLLSHIGARDDTRRDFKGARNGRFAIAPGSALFKKPPRWVMAAELVETTRVWGRVAAPIKPEWVEHLRGHLVKRSYGDPWWDRRRGSAVAHERVTLYGLPIVTHRRVDYGTVDARVAREMFIRHALVEGEWETHHAFVQDNRKLVEEVRSLEDRARRRDILVHDDALFDFYNGRVAADATSTRRFDQWWKHERKSRPDLLSFTLEMLVGRAADDVTAASHPEVWRQGDLSLRLTYEFDPGSETDGVTVEVPLLVLNRVDGRGFDWHVPSLRRELVTELIRSLPKQLRRSFVPAPDYAKAFLDRAGPDNGPLLRTLTRELALMTGDVIPPDAWQLDRVPEHLKMTFRVVDEDGRALAQGKDLEALRERLRPAAEAAIAEAAGAVEQAGLRSWSFGALDKVVTVGRRGHTVTGYPALVDAGDSVGLRVLGTSADQEKEMWRGTRRLLLLGLPSPAKVLQRNVADATKLALAHWPGAMVTQLLRDSATCTVDQLMTEAGGPAWDEQGFDALLRSVRAGFVDTMAEVVSLVGRILDTRRTIEGRLDRVNTPAQQPAAEDVRSQLSRLVHPSFVTAAGAGRLPDVLRYLQAAEWRLGKLAADPRRDRDLMARVHR
ncbi:MAG: ATP-dependent RNA helicase HrpA, partial [Actinomycetota bacterium]|nr:ATP-dependent RNA helicase HrpA [Actinomycetota bacterium]